MPQLFREFRELFSNNGRDIIGFIIAHRALNLVSYAVDIFHIYLIIKYGFWPALFAISLLFFAICLATVFIHDIAVSFGYDILYMERIRRIGADDTDNRGILKRFAGWVLKRRSTIFWLGSLWLEPDLVTLLLRKDNRVTMSNTLKITLPSNILCVTVWTIIFYLGVRGYVYFKWFIE